MVKTRVTYTGQWDMLARQELERGISAQALYRQIYRLRQCFGMIPNLQLEGLLFALYLAYYVAQRKQTDFRSHIAAPEVIPIFQLTNPTTYSEAQPRHKTPMTLSIYPRTVPSSQLPHLLPLTPHRPHHLAIPKIRSLEPGTLLKRVEVIRAPVISSPSISTHTSTHIHIILKPRSRLTRWKGSLLRKHITLAARDEYAVDGAFFEIGARGVVELNLLHRVVGYEGAVGFFGTGGVVVEIEVVGGGGREDGEDEDGEEVVDMHGW